MTNESPHLVALQREFLGNVRVVSAVASSPCSISPGQP